MSNSTIPGDRETGVKLDLTINLPTILSIFAMIAGSITYVNSQITSLNNQQLVTVGDVKVLQTQMLALTSAQMSLRADTAGQISQMRAEVRGDLRDLKVSVDQIKSENNGR
jgi:hypothetical protein